MMAERWQDAMDYARRRLLSEGWDADRVDDALQYALCSCLERGTLEGVTYRGLYLIAHRRAIDKLRRDAREMPAGVDFGRLTQDKTIRGKRRYKRRGE